MKAITYKLIICFLLWSFLHTSDLPALQTESQHFIYYYEKQDSSVIDTIISRLESNYEKILDDLEISLSSKVVIRIYPTLQDFHNAIGWSSAPDWLVGVGFTQIQVVSPLNPGPVHSYNSIMNNVILHEFVHVCTAKLNANLPAWLSEGFALYEAGPYYNSTSIVAAYKSLGRLPTLDELSNRDFFNNHGGYPFSLSIFTFINKEFGMDTIPEFIMHPNDFSVFGGITKNEFQEKWFKYFEEIYLSTSSISGKEINEKKFLLKQNFPNPFNPATIITYQLPIESKVEIFVFNSCGEIMQTLVNETKDAGIYNIRFYPDQFSSGVYLYQLNAIAADGSSFTQTNKMVFLK